MAYTIINFKTKKALKEAVKEYNDFCRAEYINDKPCRPIHCYQPGLGPDLSNYTGRVVLEGPHSFHYSKPHDWHAEATLDNGVVVKVK